MADSDFIYDVFLSHASEDTEWCEKLAERLRNDGVRVWFDRWELQAGDHLEVRINEGLEQSRKMVAVWSGNYFRDRKLWTYAEAFSRLHPDPLVQERPLIPVLLEGCNIPPLLQSLLYIDFRHPDDFELRFRELIESLDLTRREFAREEEFDFQEHGLDLKQRGRRNYAKGKRFEDEVATLYRLLGFEVKYDTQLNGVQIDLMIEQKVGGLLTQAIVECKDKRITAVERDQVLAQQNLAQKKLPRFRWIAVSSQGFAAETRTALEEAGVDCVTYPELLRELVPLDNYADGMIAEYEKEASEKWHGEDWFIRPDLLTDITYEKRPALEHLGKWLGNARANQLVVLGDLGTGKSTLAGFLSYNLARSFRDDPLRHPAPVLIPLKEVRKEVSLEGIIISHFSRRGLPGISFPRFEHLVRLGKIILLFDAFDEMADRVRWEVTRSNFRELNRAAEQSGKVILTCRTHYFKDRNEQVRLIGEGPSLSEVETELYRELRQQSGAEVVYLQEFDDGQIQAYLAKARPQTAAEDWKKIEAIYNLRDLAQRPLLLDMIVKSLPKLEAGQTVNAANLYTVYTNIWIERQEKKGSILDKPTKLGLMLELAWRMWHEEKNAIHYKDLVPFVERLAATKAIDFGDEKVEDIANEMQTASFLKRDDAGNFSFVHRSFMEYFLARKLYDCLCDPDRQRDAEALLNTRRFDRKVVFFLTLLDAPDQQEKRDRACQPLRQILISRYVPNVSENALQILYWSGRIRCGMEETIGDPETLRKALGERLPPGAKLPGANLQEIVLEAADLTEADLSGADLTKANLNHALLDTAVFRGAKLVEARGEKVRAWRADFRDAELTGALFREGSFVESDFTGAARDEILFLGCDLERAKGLPAAKRLRRTDCQPVVQRGHSGVVNAIAYSPSGEVLASGGSDGLVILYRVSDGKLLRVLEGHTGVVNSVHFSPDGERLASGGYDQSVRLWEVSSGKALRTLAGHTSVVRSVHFSPDGERLASGGDDNSVRLWEVSSGKALRTLAGHTRVVNSVHFSPDGERLASGGADQSVRLWEVASGKALRTLEGQLGPVYAVAFAPNGKYLVAAGAAGRLQFWDVEKGQTFLYRYSFGPGAWLDLLPDGRFDASPEGMRYLGYTEQGTLNSYTAEELVKEFYDPKAVQEVLAQYVK